MWQQVFYTERNIAGTVQPALSMQHLAVYPSVHAVSRQFLSLEFEPQNTK
jgi:hypothetical protein